MTNDEFNKIESGDIFVSKKNNETRLFVKMAPYSKNSRVFIGVELGTGRKEAFTDASDIEYVNPYELKNWMEY